MLLPVFNCLFYEMHGFFYFLYHVDAKCVQIIFFFKMIYIFLISVCYSNWRHPLCEIWDK